MDPLLYIIAGVLVVIAIIIVTLLKFSNASPQPVSAATDSGGERQGERAGGVRQGERTGSARQAERAGGVRRGGPRRRMVVRETRNEDTDEDEAPEVDDIYDPTGEGKKIGTKKQKKLQEKAERRSQREAEEEERRERLKRQELLDKQLEREQKRQKAEEQAQEEEDTRIREEQERAEHEEYLKLKEAFTVDDEGTHEAELGQDTESLLQEFINYIKDMKVVMLEDLAGHFKIKTQDAIDRINTLLEESRLTGVLDDRGKFIYITNDEYAAVAKFIKQRGRVSIVELAQSSNKLINLCPENIETHKKLLGEVL